MLIHSTFKGLERHRRGPPFCGNLKLIVQKNVKEFTCYSLTARDNDPYKGAGQKWPLAPMKT